MGQAFGKQHQQHQQHQQPPSPPPQSQASGLCTGVGCTSISAIAADEQPLSPPHPHPQQEQQEICHTLNLNSFWKNRNTYDADWYWLYSSLGDKNGWWFMPQKLNAEVEAAYQKDHQRISYLHGWNFDFQHMTQTGEKTRFLVRISHAEYIRMRNDYIQSILSREKLWVCTIKEGHYIYPPHMQDVLDEAQRISTAAELVCNLNNSFIYHIDMVNMIQRNDKTNRTRPISLIDPRGSASEGKPIIGSFEFIYT